MGACACKFRKKSGAGSTRSDSIQTVSFAASRSATSALDDFGFNDTKDANGFGPDSSADTLDESESNRPRLVKHGGSIELARAVEFWNTSARVRELSTQELKDRYDRDSDTLLDTLENLEQTMLSGKRRRKTGAPSIRQAAASPPSEGSSDNGLAGEPCPPQPVSPAPSQLAVFVAGGDVAQNRRALRKEPQIALACQHYDNGKMLTARAVLERWCEQRSATLDDLHGYSEALGFSMKQLLSHCKAIKKMLALLSDDTDYSISRDSDGLRVLYKCSQKQHYIKMEATLPAPLERPLALAREFDLMETWNDYVKDSRLLAAPSIWDSWVYAGMWMPFPFPQIDALAKGRGFDLSEEDRSLLIGMESVEESQLPAGAQKLPKHAAKRKRAKVIPGSTIRLEALPPKEDGTPVTKGSILTIVDPGIPHVPAFIISFVLGVVAPFAYRQIQRLLQSEFDDPDKPFPRRLAANPALYDRARTVVREGLAQHYGIAPDTE